MAWQHFLLMYLGSQQHFQYLERRMAFALLKQPSPSSSMDHFPKNTLGDCLDLTWPQSRSTCAICLLSCLVTNSFHRYVPSNENCFHAAMIVVHTSRLDVGPSSSIFCAPGTTRALLPPQTWCSCGGAGRLCAARGPHFPRHRTEVSTLRSWSHRRLNTQVWKSLAPFDMLRHS